MSAGTAEPSRIPLLERDQVTPEVANVYDALLKTRGVVPNMFKTLAHTPALALATAGYLKALLSDGALPGCCKELIALRLWFCSRANTLPQPALSARQRATENRYQRPVISNPVPSQPPRRSGSAPPNDCIVPPQKSQMTSSKK